MPTFHAASKSFTGKIPSPIQRMAISAAVFGIRQVFASTTFPVELDNGHLAGRLRRHHIKILPGDRVDVEISPSDSTKGRIVYRYGLGEARRS